jgi:excinuclease UvrABC nuclease subunit
MAGNAMRLLQEESGGWRMPASEELGRIAGAGAQMRSLACLDASNLSGPMRWSAGLVGGWCAAAGSLSPLQDLAVMAGPDDFAMLAEAVGRLAARVGSGSWTGPDVVLLDGGRGQLPHRPR